MSQKSQFPCFKIFQNPAPNILPAHRAGTQFELGPGDDTGMVHEMSI